MWLLYPMDILDILDIQSPMCVWFHGVVGYHIILTWWGSPDRTRVKPYFFLLHIITPHILYTNHYTLITIPYAPMPVCFYCRQPLLHHTPYYNCPLLFTADYYTFFSFTSERFHGVVGYHIILTWWGSPDRTRVEPFFFFFLDIYPRFILFLMRLKAPH